MVLTFFQLEIGHVSTSVLEGQRTVNSQWYSTAGLSALLENVREKWTRTRTRNTFLHHDNAPAHTSAQTATFLATNNVPLLLQPITALTLRLQTFSCSSKWNPRCGEFHFRSAMTLFKFTWTNSRNSNLLIIRIVSAVGFGEWTSALIQTVNILRKYDQLFKNYMQFIHNFRVFHPRLKTLVVPSV